MAAVTAAAAEPHPEPEDDHPTLFTLPLEIREMIYELAFELFEVNITSTTHQSTSTSIKTWNLQADIKLKAQHSNMGLLATSKQLRAEARKLWYKHTIFHFSSPIACALWLKRHVPTPYPAVIQHLHMSWIPPRTPTPQAAGRHLGSSWNKIAKWYL